MFLNNSSGNMFVMEETICYFKEKRKSVNVNAKGMAPGESNDNYKIT